MGFRVEREKKKGHACLLVSSVFLAAAAAVEEGRKEGGGEVVYGDVHDLYSSRVIFEVFAWIPSRP